MATLLFDMGNVLVYFSHQRMCDQLSQVSGLESDYIKTMLFKTPLFLRYEKGDLSTAALFERLKKEALKPMRYFSFIDAFSNIFEPNLAIISLLHELKAQNHTLILLSNTNEPHYNYIYTHYPHLKLFDDQILSYQVGLLKPDRAIYRKAMLRAQLPAAALLLIDDMPSHVRAAKRLGIRSHRFTTVPKLSRWLETLLYRIQ